MATLTNQSYSRFHPSSPPEETPTGVTLRANPDVDVVTVTPAAAPLRASPRASPPLSRARPRFPGTTPASRTIHRFPGVTTLFSRFNRDPDYAVRRRFARRSTVRRYLGDQGKSEGAIRRLPRPFSHDPSSCVPCITFIARPRCTNNNNILYISHHISLTTLFLQFRESKPPYYSLAN